MQNVQVLPNYHRQAVSPVIDTGTKAQIEIFSPSIVNAGSSAIFPLYGSFVIPEEDESKTRIHIMQAVVILIRGPYPASRQVGEGELLFPDDVSRENGLIHGCFNLDLFAHFNLMKDPNKYWISASIFNLVSNVLTIDVTQ